MTRMTGTEAQEPSLLAKVFPSTLTLAAMGSGVTSIKMAFQGEFRMSYILLFLSAVLDGLDGHAARSLNTATPFGAELDSLCDLVDFGVAPALVLYAWAVASPPASNIDDYLWYEYDVVVWVASIFYCMCCACRLARYNLAPEVPVPQPPHSTRFSLVDDVVEGDDADDGDVDVNNAERPGRRRARSRRESLLIDHVSEPELPPKKWLDAYVNRQKFFEGVPAPMGAYLTLLPMVLSFYYPGIFEFSNRMLTSRTVAAVTLFTVGFLMVANFRTLSSKMLIRGSVRARDPTTSHLHSRSATTRSLKLIALCVVSYIIYISPWLVSLIVTSLYMISLPLGHIAYYMLLTDYHQQ